MSVDRVIVAFANANGFIQVEPDEAVRDRFRAATIHRVPRLFDQLLVQYRWPEFNVGGITWFPNDGDAPAAFLELVTRDEHLWAALRDSGFVPFGRPDTGSYDHVCFDTSRSRGNDCPVVVVDHESALQGGNPKVVVRDLNVSFRALLEANS